MLEKSVTLGKKKYDLLKLNVNLSSRNLISQIVKDMTDFENEKKPFVVRELETQYNCLCSHIKQGNSILLKGKLGVGKNTMVTYFSRKNNYRLISVDASVYTTIKKCLLGILMDMWGVVQIDSPDFFSTDQIEVICDRVSESSNFEQSEKKELYSILHYLLASDVKIDIDRENFNLIICQFIVRSIKNHSMRHFLVYIKNINDATNEIQILLNYLCSLFEKEEIPCVIKEDEVEFEIQETNRDLYGKQPLFKPPKYVLEIPLLTEKAAKGFVEYSDPKIPSKLRTEIVKHLGCRLLMLSDFLQTKETGSINERLSRLPAGNLPEFIISSLQKVLEKTPFVFCSLILCNHEIPLSLIPVFISNNDCDTIDYLVSLGYLVIDDNKVISSCTLIRKNIDKLVEDKCKLKLYIYAKELYVQHINTLEKYPSIFANILLYSGEKEQAYKIMNSLCQKAKQERQYSAFIDIAEKMLLQPISNTDKAELLTDILQICSIRRDINLGYAKHCLNRFSSLIDTLQPEGKNEKYQKRLTYFYARLDFKNSEFQKCFKETTKEYENSLEGSEDEWNNRIAWIHVLCVKELEGYGAALDCFERLRASCPDDRMIKKGYLSHLACMRLHTKPSESADIYQSIITEWEREPQCIYELPFHEYVDIAMAHTCARQLDEAYDACMKAIPILESNGILSELGRAYNIRGCIWLIRNDVKKAENDFQESVSLFSESKYGLYDYRAKLNLIMLKTEQNKSDVFKKSFDEVYGFYKSNFINRISTATSIKNDSEPRVYLALIKILRIAQKMKCHEIVDDLMSEATIKQNKTQILKDCNRILPDSPFVCNNKILLMG